MHVQGSIYRKKPIEPGDALIVKLKQGKRIITRQGNYLGHSINNLIIESTRSGCWYKIPLKSIKSVKEVMK